MTTRTVRVLTTMTDEWAASAVGKMLSEPGAQYDEALAGEAVDVLKPNGELLFALRPRALPVCLATQAWEALLRAARPTNRRGTVAGGAPIFRSGIVGSYKGAATSFTRDDREGWWKIAPLVRELAVVFRRERLAEWRVSEAAAQRAPSLLFPGTPFTTLTVNRNARTAVHPDDGNLPGGYGVLSAIRSGEYRGGKLVFPKYRVAVDLGSCDVLIADNREIHGNTAIIGPGTRVSVVAYFHASNLPLAAR